MAKLLAIGASHAVFTGRGWLVSARGMLLVGALAAGLAYGIGALGAALIG